MTRTQLTLVVLLVAGVVAIAARAQAPLSYAKDVEPIIVKACSECHGGDSPKKGLDLSRAKDSSGWSASRVRRCRSWCSPRPAIRPARTSG